MHTPEWLVEIRLKDWRPDLPGNTRIVQFEEVVAHDEIGARQLGFDQFVARCRYEPLMRRRMQQWEITEADCCAPDAVQIS